MRLALLFCFEACGLSGGVAAAKGTFKLLKGEPKIYIKTAESGNKRAQAFCPECGTPVESRHTWALAPQG